MIVDERVRDYIRSLEPGQDSLCGRIAREAEAGKIPIIKKRQRHCLRR